MNSTLHTFFLSFFLSCLFWGKERRNTASGISHSRWYLDSTVKMSWEWGASQVKIVNTGFWVSLLYNIKTLRDRVSHSTFFVSYLQPSQTTLQHLIHLSSDNKDKSGHIFCWCLFFNFSRTWTLKTERALIIFLICIIRHICIQRINPLPFLSGWLYTA